MPVRAPPETFSNVKGWMQEIERYASEDVKKLIIGNKSDLVERKVVEYSAAKEFADALSIPFIETSAKQRINVDEAFSQLVREIRKYNKVRVSGVFGRDLR